MNSRDRSAHTRNDIELHRLLKYWERFAGKTGRHRVQFHTLVFEPESGEGGPLSWHLTPQQISHLESLWTPRLDALLQDMDLLFSGDTEYEGSAP